MNESDRLAVRTDGWQEIEDSKLSCAPAATRIRAPGGVEGNRNNPLMNSCGLFLSPSTPPVCRPAAGGGGRWSRCPGGALRQPGRSRDLNDRFVLRTLFESSSRLRIFDSFR